MKNQRGRPRNSLPMPQRFWDKTELVESGCLEWQGSIFKASGYGQFAVNGKKRETAHRMSWLLTKGEIPDGLWVLHKCDNRICCNPDHLFLGDATANNKDMAAKGRHVGSRGTTLSAEHKAAISAWNTARWEKFRADRALGKRGK